jgi:hypothetical protein
MYPNRSRHGAALDGERRPGLAAVGVAFVGGRGAEGEGETDDETENCEEEAGYIDWSGSSCVRYGSWGLGEGDVRGVMNMWRQVMRVAQAPTMAIGMIMRGRTLPCIRRKYGSLVCFSRSLGPTYCSNVISSNSSTNFP